MTLFSWICAWGSSERHSFAALTISRSTLAVCMRVIAAALILASVTPLSAAILRLASDSGSTSWDIIASPSDFGRIEEGFDPPGVPSYRIDGGRFRYVSAHSSSSASDGYAAVRVDLQPDSVNFFAMVGTAPGTNNAGSFAIASIGGSIEIVAEPGEEIGQPITLYSRTSLKYNSSEPPPAGELPDGLSYRDYAYTPDGAFQSSIGATLPFSVFVSALLYPDPGPEVYGALSVRHELSFAPSISEAAAPLHPRVFGTTTVGPEGVDVPTSVGPDGMHFHGATSGGWIDPPVTDGFVYTMDSDSLFTAIQAFPNGFGSAFTVAVEDVTLPMSFAPGDILNFADWSIALGSLLVDGQGVRSFRLTGITPSVDVGDDLAFPLKLAFNTPTADLTMTAIVPEPSTTALAAVATLCLATVLLHTRRYMRRAGARVGTS